MENQSGPQNGQNAHTEQNKENGNGNPNGTNTVQTIPDNNTNVRETNQQQVDPNNSGQGIPEPQTEREQIRSKLGEKYSYTRAAQEYEPGEMQPQLAEHWRYTGPGVPKCGHF